MRTTGLGSPGTCPRCGWAVEAGSDSCGICGSRAGRGRRAGLRRISRRRRSQLLWGFALGLAGFVALYLYPNFRYHEREIAPRYVSEGVEFVPLSPDAGSGGWRALARGAMTDGATWSDWVLHGVRFALPDGGPLAFAGDARQGVVLLDGWQISYSFGRGPGLPSGAAHRIEGEAALEDLRAAARDEFEFLADIYGALPTDFHFLYTPGARARLRVRLALKEALALPGAMDSIRRFESKSLRGFLFGIPGESREIGLQILRDEGRLDLVARAVGKEGGERTLAVWAASVLPASEWLSGIGGVALMERLERLRTVPSLHRPELQRALFLAVGLATTGSDQGRRALAELTELARPSPEAESMLDRATMEIPGAGER
ncbi:MAG: hypothetical protein HY720_00245 [Planctomycetes bacterium]|nr:hypothetical protein [Planctomycetota bacterium]